MPALISLSLSSMTLSPPPQPAHSADYALWTLLTLKNALPLKFSNLSIHLSTNPFLPYFLVPTSLGTPVYCLLPFFQLVPLPFLGTTVHSIVSPLASLNNQTSKTCLLSFISRLLFCFIVVCFKPCHVACGILLPPPGTKPVPLQWKYGALTSGPLEKSIFVYFWTAFLPPSYTALLVLLPIILLYFACIALSPRSKPVVKLLTKTTSDFSVTKTSRQVSVLCASELFLLPRILFFPT